jgi:phage gp36-like protein
VAYATTADVKKILKDTIFEYSVDIDEELDYATTFIDSALSGHFVLPFDDVTQYATVPVQIKWIAAYLVAYKLWDSQVSLEGQTDDTAAGRWLQTAKDWLAAIRDGEMALTLADGTAVTSGETSGTPRFYPSGTRTKAASEDNDPFFTRAQAHDW